MSNLSRSHNPEALESAVNSLLKLAQQEISTQDNSIISSSIALVKTLLKKVTNPRFEIILVGTFSAGKSTVLNALLNKELLYSDARHTTGTKCYIQYAEEGEEKIQQVFFNGQEIGQRVKDLCQQLAIQELNNNSEKNIWEAITQSIAIIKHKFKNTEEKNHNKKILESLLTAIENNKDKIDFTNRKSSNPIPFNSQQSQDFTDREKTAGIIESFNYYYHNTLLKDGNVFVDLPGIDAPIEADAQIALDKLKDEKTSAIIFILETASKGEITLPEREVMDIINNNSSISSRVFWLFNRIDSIWKGEESDEYKAYKKVRDEEFSSKERCYETSALLGLYGNLLLSAGELNQSNEFGLQSLMNQAIYNKNQQFFE
ncbi:dynamin family protein, partial [Aphanothece sacrum]